MNRKLILILGTAAALVIIYNILSAYLALQISNDVLRDFKAVSDSLIMTNDSIGKHHDADSFLRQVEKVREDVR